jgi:hypothetical protein
MFVIVDIQTIVHAKSVGNTRFHMHNSIGSVLIAMKPKAKEHFLHSHHIIVLHSMKIILNRNYIFFQNLLYIISGSLSQWH